MSKTLRSKKRAAAKKCEDLGVSVGDRISVRIGHQTGIIVTVTAIGMTSILVKPVRYEERTIKEPSEILGKYELVTVGFTFTPEAEVSVLSICSQCGNPFSSPACGPTHALIANERANTIEPEL